MKFFCLRILYLRYNIRYDLLYNTARGQESRVFQIASYEMFCFKMTSDWFRRKSSPSQKKFAQMRTFIKANLTLHCGSVLLKPFT